MTSSKNDLSEFNSSLKSIDDNDKKIYSKNDLNNHLNEIKNVLRDKERDLSLAAEIGQQLLEANTVLKKAYEELFIQNQDAQKQLHRYEQLTEVRSGRSSPVPSNSSPLSPRYRAMRSRNNSPTPPRSKRGSRNLSLPPSVRLDGTGASSPSSSLARSSDSFESENEDVSNSLKEQYLEKIRFLENSLNSLERHNEELRVLLEKKKEEVKDIQIQNSKLLLIKDGEVYDLKQELESLMVKTKKLEMEKKNLTKENQRQANELDRIETVDQEYIQDLLVKINRLDGSLKKMENTKEELEKNIENIMVEKLEYQNKCKSLDKKLQDYLYYKHLHDTQAQHIQELNQTIEQQRMQIQNLDFQLYNLSMSSSDGSKPEIKFSEKYLLENPESMENLQKSTNSLGSKSSSYISNLNDAYDNDTLVITAKRNINSTSSLNKSVQSSTDPLLTLSTNNMGKKSLYSELESTDWYDKKDTIESSNPSLNSHMIKSSSDTVLNKRNDLLKSHPHQPSNHQYQSSYSLGRRKTSASSNDEALTLVDKANQSFNNNNIEKIIKPQIKNDVNSYEVLINSIENEFKNSEEIHIRDDNDKDNETILDNKLDSLSYSSTSVEDSIKNEDKTEINRKKDLEDDLDLSISSIPQDETSKISYDADKNDSVIDDTTHENNQSSRHVSSKNNPNPNPSYARPKSAYPSISNPKTLALIKHSNIPLFDYKKLSNMIENDKTLNPQNMKNSASEDSIPPRPTKPQTPLLQGHMRRMSFDSIFRNFELSKLQSTHLLTDGNSTNSNKNRKSKKNGFMESSPDKANPKNGNGMSILENVVRLSSPPPVDSPSTQEMKDNGTTSNYGNASVISPNTPFFMPKPSSFAHSMAPINADSNKEFNNLIKNFHLASPVTPLIANINLNNAIREEEASTTSVNPSPLNPLSPPPTKSKLKKGSDAKPVFTLKNKPLFSVPKRILSPKLDATSTESPEGNHENILNLMGNSKVPTTSTNDENTGNTMEEVPMSYNGMFNPNVNGSSILSSNVIMNNQVMLDQYRNTLNHYSNSGSAILQVLIDSWLRFLNGFVGYGSDIAYDINTMNYGDRSATGSTSKFYTQDSSRSSFSEDVFDPTDPLSPTDSAAASSQNLKALTPSKKI